MGRCMKKLFRRAISFALTIALILSSFQGLNTIAYAAGETTALTDSDLAATYSDVAVNRVSVHDPSVVYDGVGTYYIFGSHLAWAKSTDLKNWTTFTNNINTNFTTLFATNFVWAAMGDSAYTPNGNMWAPDVIYNAALGKWCMYMSINGCSWNSSIAMLTASSLDGDWTYVGTVIYSGFTDAANNHDFTLTDYDEVTGDTTLPARYIQSSYTCRDGATTTASTTWNKATGAHAIDPCVFYGQDGKLYMTYGSWSGGIYIIELNKATGLRDTSVTYSNTPNSSDPYMGIKLAGGYQTSGEASYVEYINGYYYLFVTNGGLTAKGGYNMRVYRSSNPTGPYTDVSGQSPMYTTGVANVNSDVGTRLMSYYKWNYQQYAQVAQGHNSAVVGPDGKAYVVYHTRSNDGTEVHSVRVHQLFTTKNHYLVAAPFEYNGETVSPTGYSSASVVGSYEVILQNQSVDYTNLGYCGGQALTLNGDGTISGDYTGTWAAEAGTPYVTLSIGGISYEGLFVEQTIEGTNINTMAFTVVGTNDVCMWGAKYPSAEAAIAMTKKSISVATETYSNITLPTTGIFGANVSWSSSNPAVIANDGTVIAPGADTNVTLTATISRDGKSYQKNYTVLVHKSVGSYSEIQVLASAYINDPQDLSTHLDGSLSMPNPYRSASNLDVSKGVKIKFDVESTGVNKVLATVMSFMGNNGSSGRLYFTPGSYLGYNAAGGWFDANMHSYGMVHDYIGATKSTVEISLTPSGFEVDVNGTKAYDQSILSNSAAGAGTLTDYNNILNWLTNTADTVYFGKGSWWGAAGFDEALCKISNVYFYGYLMPSYKLMSESGIQEIASAYVNNPQDLSTKLDGSLSMTNPFRTIANLDTTKDVKIKFDVESTGTKNVLAAILSFMGNRGLNGRLYFSPGSYLGYNATGGYFDANLHSYAMVTDYIGSSKSTVEITFTSTGFEVDVNGVKAYDQSIVSDPAAGGGNLTDYNNVLNWITTKADEVFFGKGSWWADPALCSISNVYFYGYAQPASAPTVTLGATTVTYDGTAKTPAVTVQDGATTLVAGTDYTVTYSNNTDVGTATVTVTGTGKYKGTITKTFTITAKDASTLTVTLGTNSFTYDGSAKTPNVTVNNGSTTLVAGTDYTVAYTNNTNVGTASITITGKGNYTGTITTTFAIVVPAPVIIPPTTVTITPTPTPTPKVVSTLSVALEASTYTYQGTAITPEVTVKDGTKTLVKGTDFTVSYLNNINVGTATVTVSGTGDYTGTSTKTFTIAAKDASTLTVRLGSSSYTYDGSANTPKATVMDGTTVLKDGTDYTVSYKDNTDAGTAKVMITGKGNYTGSVNKTFTIKEKSVASLTVTLNKSNYSYTGKAIKPEVTVKDGTTALVEGTDYTVFYSDNKKPGEATVKVKGKGNYSGIVTKTFTIKLDAPSVTVKAGKKSIKVEWDTVSGATGYVVYMATSKDGAYTEVYTADADALSFTKDGLKAKKTYYFKVVAYTEDGSTKVYSDSSSVVSVKVK